MKRLVFLALCAALAGSCGNGANNGVREILTTENTEADLGVIREADGTVQVTLVVPNASADTLYPSAAYTHCRCVFAEVDRTPVPPGGQVRVGVEYNPAYRKGIFMEEIYVKMLSEGDLSLIIKGEIVPMAHPLEEDHPYDFGDGLLLSHEVLSYGRLAPGTSKDMFIRYANGSGQKMRLDFLADPALAGALDSRAGLALPPEGRDTLHFRFTMPESLAAGDTLKLPVRLSVNGKMLEKSLLVRAVCK